MPHQNRKEHTKSLRERVGREVEKARSWKLETEKSEERKKKEDQKKVKEEEKEKSHKS
jgi:hypothetical protein